MPPDHTSTKDNSNGDKNDESRKSDSYMYNGKKFEKRLEGRLDEFASLLKTRVIENVNPAR